MSEFPPVPPAQAPVMPPNEAKRPGAGGYFAGAGIMIVGIVAGIVLLVIGFSSLARVFSFPDRAAADGSVQIDRAGPYVVYLIRPDPGTTFTPIVRPSVTVTGPDGSARFTGEYNGSRTQTSGFDQAVAVATFTADTPGTYHVTAASLSSGESLGVGDGRKVKTGSIALGFVTGGVAFLVGLVLIIVTASRRHRAKPYPMVPGYPAAGYPPVPQGYPPVQPGYPPVQQGYPPVQPGYPPVQPGYPPAQQGYPPAPPTYPPAAPTAEPPSDQEWWKQDPQQGPPS